MGLAGAGDQAVGEAEGAQAGDVCGVTLGPVGGAAVLGGVLPAPAWREDRRGGLDADAGELRDDVLAQFVVADLVVVARTGPAFGGGVGGLAVLVFGAMRLGEYPGDYGEFVGVDGLV